MLAAERRARIQEVVRTFGTVTTNDLSEQLDVSPETIRRDLLVLERSNALTRVHGGATRARPVTGTEPAFVERASTASDAKQAIGERGARLVEAGQCVMIDVGTTAVHVARSLPSDLVCTVVTCSMLVAMELADKPNVEVIVSGGRVRRGDLALSGAQAREFFESIRPDVAFLGSGGVHEDAGLTDFHFDEAIVRRTIISNSSRSYVLADSAKFGVVGRYTVAPLRMLTGFITEKEPPEDVRKAIDRQGGKVLLP